MVGDMLQFYADSAHDAFTNSSRFSFLDYHWFTIMSTPRVKSSTETVCRQLRVTKVFVNAAENLSF